MNMPVGAAEIAFSDSRNNRVSAGARPRHSCPRRSIGWTAAGSRRRCRRRRRDGSTRGSPRDGRRLAFDLFDGTQHDVWTYDWSRDALTRLTFDPAADNSTGLDPGCPPDRLQIRTWSRPSRQTSIGSALTASAKPSV